MLQTGAENRTLTFRSESTTNVLKKKKDCRINRVIFISTQQDQNGFLTEDKHAITDLLHYSIACIVFKPILKYLIEKRALCKWPMLF